MKTIQMRNKISRGNVKQIGFLEEIVIILMTHQHMALTPHRPLQRTKSKIVRIASSLFHISSVYSFNESYLKESSLWIKDIKE